MKLSFLVSRLLTTPVDEKNAGSKWTSEMYSASGPQLTDLHRDFMITIYVSFWLWEKLFCTLLHQEIAVTLFLPVSSQQNWRYCICNLSRPAQNLVATHRS